MKLYQVDHRYDYCDWMECDVVKVFENRNDAEDFCSKFGKQNSERPLEYVLPSEEDGVLFIIEIETVPHKEYDGWLTQNFEHIKQEVCFYSER